MSCNTVCVCTLLSWNHDFLGPGIWTAMDSGLLLLYLDLSCSPAQFRNKVLLKQQQALLNVYTLSLSRKLKPHRMLWFVFANFVHILLLMIAIFSANFPMDVSLSFSNYKLEAVPTFIFLITSLFEVIRVFIWSTMN